MKINKTYLWVGVLALAGGCATAPLFAADTRPAEPGVVKTGTAADVAAAKQADAERAKKKVTLAVLPFVGGTQAEKDLAEKMRFAVAQKMSRDGRFVREDNVEVEQAVSALQIPWDAVPAKDDMDKVLDLIDKDVVVMGEVAGRKLTLWMYEGKALKKEVSGEIPDSKDSPRLAVEKLLSDLAGMRFVVRDVEADHSDPETEALWVSRSNLIADGGFEEGAKTASHTAEKWWGILMDKQWHPRVTVLAEAQNLPADSVAIVPAAMALGDGAAGSCLFMRISKHIAENNGLACVSDWIPVEDGQKYRFAARYHSTGPTARVFIKGFAYAPDQYGDKTDPEATRREYYRAQVLPREGNKGWDLLEMDFTPAALAKYPDKKIQWMRVDFYLYLKAGDVWFDDVVVKKIDK